MCGQGIDRHLFALYVVQRYLEEESTFMNKVMPPTYLLSTSQTPLNQCEEEAKSLTPEQRLSLVSAGGGFGPVADKGYGVSYIIAGEDQVSFHISSKVSADNTVSFIYLNLIILYFLSSIVLLKFKENFFRALLFFERILLPVFMICVLCLLNNEKVVPLFF